MAFTDMPVIDRPSINSETSIQRFKDFINLQSGFQVRIEWPDTGCDLNIELILGSRGASSQIFPVQIKSIEKVSVVKDRTYISHFFETSRLGYLMRRLPAMGIVVLYSVEENKCFFDYADKIYERLMEERGSDDWKQNHEVSIHVPYVNVLAPDTAQQIHQIMAARFEQAIIMQNSFGPKYGLPSLTQDGEPRFDFRNPDDIKRFLKEYGMMLINNHDVDMIFQMVSQLPHREISESKELLILSALSYQEVGYYSDAQFFSSKLAKFQLSEEEQLMATFLKLKTDLNLGYISTDAFLEGINRLASATTAPQNILVLKLNSLKLRMAAIQPATSIPSILVETVLSLFGEIELANITIKTRTILTLLNCEILSHAIGHESGMFLGEMQLRERLHKPFSAEERLEKSKHFFKWEEIFYSILEKAYRTVNGLNDFSIKAQILSVRAFNYLQRQINILSFDVPPIADSNQILINNIKFGATAYNYFMKVNAYKDGYDVLCNTIDLIELAIQQYHLESPVPKDQLYVIKRQMESNLDLKPRDFIFPKLIQKIRDRDAAPPHSGMPTTETMSDDQIHSIAVKIHSATHLPTDHLVNIEDELRAYRTFHQRCKDPHIEILQWQVPNRYAQAVRFILRNKRTGIETISSDDMDKLLTGFGF
jgi:hypothetical protein